MKIDAKTLKKTYSDWIESNLHFNDICDDWIEIETPFTNYIGDVIYIFAKRFGDKIRLTDYGATVNELEMSNILTPSRKPIFDRYLSGQNCICRDGEIYTEFEYVQNFPVCKHKLMQALINVNDMFALSKDNVKNLFLFDIKEYLDNNDISYSPTNYFLYDPEKVFSFSFELSIGKRKKLPALNTKVVNRFDENTSHLICFMAEHLIVGNDERIAVILNDEKIKEEKKSLKILEDRDIDIIRWSERDKFLLKYAA